MPTQDGRLTVGILIFDDVEVLDFCGPFEVFSVAGRLAATNTSQAEEDTAINVYNIAQSRQLIKARGNLLVQPHYTIQDHPSLDVLVVPGGRGTQAAAQQEEVITWVKNMAAQVTITSSVCTGAFILGKAGLLEGYKATTHWGSIDRLSQEFPHTEVQRDVRWVDEGKLVTSAGVEAGIDMSLHLVERLLGRDAAETTTKHMEYNWQENKHEQS